MRGSVDAKDIANRLSDRDASEDCDACGERLTVIEDQYYLVQKTDVRIGIPVAAVTCTNCGYIRLHAIQALEP
jgi:hypothetical protein